MAKSCSPQLLACWWCHWHHLWKNVWLLLLLFLSFLYVSFSMSYFCLCLFLFVFRFCYCVLFLCYLHLLIYSYFYLFVIFICFCFLLLLILYLYLLSFLMIYCWFFLYLLIVLLNIVYISNPHGTLWLQCAASIVAAFIADRGGCNVLPLDPFFMSGSFHSGDWGPFQQEVLQCDGGGPLAEKNSTA